MGTQQSHNIGYGIRITKEAKEIFASTQEDEYHDLWEEVDTAWPSLSYSLCGRYWEHYRDLDIVCIASSVIELPLYETTEINNLVEPSPEDKALLDDFITKHMPGAKAGWMFWNYSG
jgi:hypothetical protein